MRFPVQPEDEECIFSQSIMNIMKIMKNQLSQT